MATEPVDPGEGHTPDGEILDWFERLVREWRAAWERLDPGARERHSPPRSPSSLVEPAQFCAYVLSGESAPLEATAIVVEHDDGRPDREVRLLRLFEDEQRPPKGDAPFHTDAVREVRDLWGRMRSNWTPGRRADNPPPQRPMPFRMEQRQGWETSAVLWVLDGSFPQTPVEEVVRWSFRAEVIAPSATLPSTPPPSPPPPPAAGAVMVTGPHIYNAGMDRERFAVARWLDGPFGHDLFQALGFRGSSWWCGVGLDRRDIFGEKKLDGDVDVIAGPIEFALTEGEFKARLDEEAKRHPLTMPRGAHVEAVLHAAAQEGRIVWPPRVEYIGACEAKASGYHSESGTIKASHSREGERIKGQLDMLLDRGVDRVGFLHIMGSSVPAATEVNPWLTAAAVASQAAEDTDFIYNPSDRPTCGYFTVAIGAVAHKTEEFAGSGGRLYVRQPCGPNMSDNKSWRRHLRDELAKLPRPMTWRFFILPCQKCGKWVMYSSPSLNPSCGCG
jgi:hypothetical protein